MDMATAQSGGVAAQGGGMAVKYIRPRDVARIYSLSKSKVYELTAVEGCPRAKIDGRIMVDAEKFEHWLFNIYPHLSAEEVAPDKVEKRALKMNESYLAALRERRGAKRAAKKSGPAT